MYTSDNLHQHLRKNTGIKISHLDGFNQQERMGSLADISQSLMCSQRKKSVWSEWLLETR